MYASLHAEMPGQLPPGAPTAAPALTLVICTRNRASQLERCLASLSGIQADRPWELVLVDNGSADATSRVIARFGEQARFPITTLFEPRPGTGCARNRGWRAARGGIVAFIDDDCYPQITFVESVLSVFDADGSLGYLGGRIALYDPLDFPITIQEHPDRITLPPRSCVPPGLIQTANLSVRRAALEAIGGFDERFGAGTRFPCEDVDLTARISAVGWSGAYDPGPLVYHHHGRRNMAEVCRLMYQYDRGRGAYYAKCLVNPAIRASTARYWGHQILQQPVRKTAREWLAAAEYCLRTCAAISGRWLRWGRSPAASK